MRILYIDVDSLRPDHLGCYGYHRNTSPAIDQIAREGLVCERAYASDAPCLPSRTAFYSGRFGIQTGVVGHGGIASQPKVQTMAFRGFRDTFVEQGWIRNLARMGWHTAMISPFAQRHAAHWFYAGFHEIHNTGHEGMESAEYVQPFVDRWMRENATRDNWFLHLNYWDPHTPYRMPQDYGNPFANDPLPAWLEEPGVLERHIAKTGPHSALDGAMYHDTTDPRYPRHPYRIDTPQQLRRAIDGYDTGIRYADEHIGKVVAALKAAGVYEETAIIISADHGENQGELGIYGEHPTADEITCRIPLIIKFPGGVAGRRDRGFHYHLDLAPTLMDLVGGRSFEIWDGESFAETVRTGAEAGRAEVVVSQCAMVCQRSVRWDQWLYMRTYHDGFHLFPQEMLFDIVADPHEQHDLASAWPEICREGAWRLMRWHDAQLQKMSRFASDSLDPLWTVLREGGPFHASLGQTPDPGGVPGLLRYLEHLEATGRSEGAARLREKYGRALLQ